MVKINYKKDIKAQIISNMARIKQAYYLDDSRKLCVIEGELKNKQLINWFLDIDPECEISYADDFDSDAIVLTILNDVKRTISHTPPQKKIRFISDMEEFDNCRFTSVEEFSEDVIGIIFGKPRLFKRIGILFELVLTKEDYSVNNFTSDEYYMIKKHLERFCSEHNYKIIQVADFLKMLKVFWVGNKE